MPLDVQVKLLRILETSTFRRMGGNHDIRVNVRFVFASNKILADCVNRGEFREDLYHRINLLPIPIPPLRQRPEDIIPLSWYFIQQCNENDSRSWEITDEAMASLCAYQWPGNVRELRNTIRRACILANQPIITPDLFPFAPQKATYTPAASVTRTDNAAFTASPLWAVERDHIQKVLELVEQNKSQAAKLLEIDRKTLYSKLERYGLEV
jgi:two-component system NtrC family response regulator